MAGGADAPPKLSSPHQNAILLRIGFDHRIATEKSLASAVRNDIVARLCPAS